MVDLASLDDVENRYGPLSEAESVHAATLITQASAMVRAQVPTVDDRLLSGALSSALTTGAVADAVVRVLDNPRGKSQESIDDFAFRRSDAVASGRLYIAVEDLILLRDASTLARVGSVRLRARGYEAYDPSLLPTL